MSEKQYAAGPEPVRDLDISGANIVHVVPTPVFAGTERYALNLALALARRGAEVTLVGGDPDLVPQLVAASGTHIEHQPAHNLATAMRRLASLRGVDLVHAHLTSAEIAATVVFPFRQGPWARFAPGPAASAPAVVSTRHIAARRGSSVGGRMLSPWVRRRLDGQLAISNFVARAIDGASAVVHTGVPSQPPGPHDEKTVVVAQRLEAEKDTATALRAWAASGLAEAAWELEILGTGAERPRLEELARRLGLQASCRFLGRVDDVPGRLARAGAFLATALAEPLGLSVIEAMATATAVVATGSGGHLETVGQCEGAALFDPGDHQTAAAHLRALASDATARASYGQRLRRLQQERFELEGFVDAVATWYLRALRRPA